MAINGDVDQTGTVSADRQDALKTAREWCNHFEVTEIMPEELAALLTRREREAVEAYKASVQPSGDAVKAADEVLCDQSGGYIRHWLPGSYRDLRDRIAALLVRFAAEAVEAAKPEIERAARIEAQARYKHQE